MGPFVAVIIIYHSLSFIVMVVASWSIRGLTMYLTVLSVFLNLDIFTFKVMVVASWSTGGLTSSKNKGLLGSHLVQYMRCSMVNY